MPTIEYNLHDSVVLTTEFEEVGKLTITIRLYEIYNPEASIVKLTIWGIANVKEVKAFHAGVMKHSRKTGWLGYRIDEFKQLNGQLSKAEGGQLWLSIDHFEPLSIKCRKYNFSKIDE